MYKKHAFMFLLPSFIALFSCSLLHWVVIFRGWYCGVTLL